MAERLLRDWFAPSSPIDSSLKIPFDYQPDNEDECAAYCIWMSIHYFRNKHPNKDLRKETRGLSIDEILEEMTIVEGGWRPNQDELTLLSEETRTLHFSLEFWQDGAPKGLREYVTEAVSNELPLIVFINGHELREEEEDEDEDGVHAVVVAGYGEDDYAIHDPWGYPEDVVSSDKLKDVWDEKFNQLITVSLSQRGKKITGKKS